jgi:hypothetical protein
MTERLIDRAVALLEAGRLVPVDLIFQLTEAGIDFSALEELHAQ